MSLPYMPIDSDGLLNLLNRIFGDTIFHIIGKDGNTDPQNWLIPTLIQSLNVFIWAISGIILSAMVIWQVGRHANKNQADKINLLNEPIKNVSGMILLMPTAFGFNIVSLLVIVCSLWGIQGGNQIYTAAVKQQLHHAMYFEAKYFIEQKVQLNKFALDYISSSYCAKLLSSIYSKAYGNDDSYAKIIPDTNQAYQTAPDVSGNYYTIVPFTDVGQAQTGGKQPLCGKITFKQPKLNSQTYNSNAGSASNFASGGLLGQADKAFNNEFNQLAQELHQRIYEIWNDQAQQFMTEIDTYIDKTLPDSNYDNKYENLQSNIPHINDIIKNHQEMLVQRLSEATDSNTGFMHNLHNLYTQKMQEGGILNAIGYRQHFGQIRKYLLEILTDSYIIPSGSTKFADYLPKDNISQTAQAVYYGVMQNVQTGINTSADNSNINCPVSMSRLQNILADKNQIEQIQPEYLKITGNQLAAVLNIILGRTEAVCHGYTNITDSNPQSQTQSLDRLQQAGAVLANLAGDREIQAKYLQLKPDNTDNQNIKHTIQELKQSAPLLKSAGTWLSIVLPSILDFFLIIAIALFPIKIVTEMIIGSVSAMLMFVPNTKSAGTFAKHGLGIILYIPAVTVGYFSANVILNYVLELGIGLSYESLHYSLMQGGSIDIEHFKTVTMIFVSIGGAITMMCGSLILGVPAAVSRFLQVTEGDANSSLATTKIDGSAGSAGAGSAASGQIFGAGSSAGADRFDDRGKRDIGYKDTAKNEKPTIVSDDQGTQNRNIHNSKNN